MEEAEENKRDVERWNEADNAINKRAHGKHFLDNETKGEGARYTTALASQYMRAIMEIDKFNILVPTIQNYYITI